jgi:hypothetical protein
VKDDRPDERPVGDLFVGIEHVLEARDSRGERRGVVLTAFEESVSGTPARRW